MHRNQNLIFPFNQRINNELKQRKKNHRKIRSIWFIINQYYKIRIYKADQEDVKLQNSAINVKVYAKSG